MAGETELALTEAPVPDTFSANGRQAIAAALIERCAEGDCEALSGLYDMFAGLVITLTRRILGSLEEAEEVLQDVFLYVWQRAARYDPSRSSVSTWLVMIARSRAIDRLRRAHLARRMRERLTSEPLPSAAVPRAHAGVLAQQRRKRLNAALSNLPSAQRQAVELAYYAEMTQAEIAQQAEIPLGTVKTRTHLAMGKLRAALSPEVAELM